MKSNFLNWDERPTQRLKIIEDALKMDPFLYHKKKNVISSGFNDSNENEGQNINQELLFCQDENYKQINSLKKKIKLKSSSIENNTNNYLNFMMREKKLNSVNKIVPTEVSNLKLNKKRINQFLFKESFTPNKYAINNSNNNYNYNALSKYRNNINIRRNNINDLNLLNRQNISNGYNNFENNSLNVDESDINNNDILNNNDISNGNINRNNSFLPRIQSFKGTTDITDNNYYDKISKQLIIQMNKNYLDYNQNLVNQRYSPNNVNKSLFLKNDKLAIPPGHISNPKYYNLGESKLKSNPIVYPGNRAPIFNQYNNFNHNHKLKSEFC